MNMKNPKENKSFVKLKWHRKGCRGISYCFNIKGYFDYFHYATQRSALYVVNAYEILLLITDRV